MAVSAWPRRHDLSARRRRRGFCLSGTGLAACLRLRSTQTVRGYCPSPKMRCSRTERRPPRSRLSGRQPSGRQPADSLSRPRWHRPNGAPRQWDGCDKRFRSTGEVSNKDCRSRSCVRLSLSLHRSSRRQSVFRQGCEAGHPPPAPTVRRGTPSVSVPS